MRIPLLFATIGAAAAVLAVPAALAQAQTPTVEVSLANFRFTPTTLNLTAGKAVHLHFVNAGKGGHSFSAPEFFRAAVFSAGAEAVKGGRIELDGGASADVTLTPASGHYTVKCAHFLHAGMGMTGEIIVS